MKSTNYTFYHYKENDDYSNYLKTYIETSCNKHNFILVLENVNTNTINFIKDILNNIDNNKIYLNVKIINIIKKDNGTKNILYIYKNIYKLDKFYKVSNVYIGLQPTILPGVINYDRHYRIHRNEGDIYFKLYDYNSIRTIAPKTKSNDLIDKWWFKIINTTSPCARSRFLQSSGTCWMNSILNILIMSIPIQNRMIEIWKREYKKDKDYQIHERYNNEDKKIYSLFKIPFTEFNYEDKIKTVKLKYYIYSIIYNLFINYTRPSSSDGDIILPIAAKVKSLGICNNDIRNGHHTCLSKLRSKTITNKEELYNNNIDEGEGGQFSDISYLIKEYFDDNDFYILDERFLPLESRDFNQIIDRQNKYMNIEIEHFNNSRFIIYLNFNSFKAFIKEFININGIIYKLYACALVCYKDDIPSHSIVGITCNEKRYVYDSNNFTTDDDWLINKWVKNHNIINKEYGQIYNKYEYDGLIYIQENLINRNVYN